MAGRTSRRAPPPALPPRRAVWAALALSLAGLALSIALVRLHRQAHAGVASFCAISETVNCDRVATSRYSVVLGLPVALWGVFGYGVAVALAASGLSRRGPTQTWPSGLLVCVGAAASVVSLALALVSTFAIGALCLLCSGLWVVAAALLVAAWRGCRPLGVAAAVQADLAVVRANRTRAAAFALVGAGAIALVATAYPRYWEGRPVRPPAAPAGPGPAVMVEYSDYQCPMCALAHEETRAFAARRPDVTLVRRHFPLDSSCNPALKRPMHPQACALARAAICAEAQGRFAEMDDALFENQRDGLPIPAIAERLGLDMGRFRECLASAETERRLAADIAAAIRDGVKATPTFVVRGVPVAGRIPVELLPPPPGGGAGVSEAEAGRPDAAPAPPER